MKRRQPGFTLLELLAVMAVLSLLLGILMPAMSRARDQGKRIVCLSRLRQMHLASQVYVQDQDGYYPISNHTQSVEGGVVQHCWDFSVWPGETSEVRPGTLWQGDAVERIQQCPSFRGESNTPLDPYSGYNYNKSYIGHGEGEEIVEPIRAAAVLRPSECAVFGDGQWSGGANKFMRSPLRAPADRTFNGRYAGTQGFRHDGRTNVAWADGHTESVGAVYVRTEPARFSEDIEDHNQANPDCPVGFLSADNSAYDLD